MHSHPPPPPMMMPPPFRPPFHRGVPFFIREIYKVRSRNFTLLIRKVKARLRELAPFSQRELGRTTETWVKNIELRLYNPPSSSLPEPFRMQDQATKDLLFDRPRLFTNEC